MLPHTSYRTMLGTDLAVPIDVPEGKKKQWKVVTQEGGWADNMSQVDFGSWITNDFEKWITLKVAIPGQKVLTGQGDLPPTFLTSPYHLAQRKTKGSEDVVLVRAAGSKRPKSPLGCANRP